VPLQAPTAAAVAAPSVSVEEDEEEIEEGSGVVKILSGVLLGAALVVLVLQLMTANTWLTDSGLGWGGLF